MSGFDINKEFLIALIEERPALWDKSDDTYKDRNATKASLKIPQSKYALSIHCSLLLQQNCDSMLGNEPQIR
jgi:hypothetical protein